MADNYTLVNGIHNMREHDIVTHVVFVGCLVHKDGKYLLARRHAQDKQAGGMWAPPGGKVDDLTTGFGVVEETVKRELHEEVGVEIQGPLRFLTSQGFVRVSGHHVVSLIFTADWASGQAFPGEDQDEIGWFSAQEIENLAKNEGIEYLLPVSQILLSGVE